MNIQFIPGRDDGDTDHDFEGCVYLHLRVVVDGEHEGSLTGYYSTAVAGHIRTALGAQTKHDGAADARC